MSKADSRSRQIIALKSLQFTTTFSSFLLWGTILWGLDTGRYNLKACGKKLSIVALITLVLSGLETGRKNVKGGQNVRYSRYPFGLITILISNLWVIIRSDTINTTWREFWILFSSQTNIWNFCTVLKRHRWYFFRMYLGSNWCRCG